MSFHQRKVPCFPRLQTHPRTHVPTLSYATSPEARVFHYRETHVGYREEPLRDLQPRFCSRLLFFCSLRGALRSTAATAARGSLCLQSVIERRRRGKISRDKRSVQRSQLFCRSRFFVHLRMDLSWTSVTPFSSGVRTPVTSKRSGSVKFQVFHSGSSTLSYQPTSRSSCSCSSSVV